TAENRFLIYAKQSPRQTTEGAFSSSNKESFS
ncbi:MAG: hypothetical protein ACI9WC_001049, partial [Arenicella sp.]